MRRFAVVMALLCVLTVSASAAYIPDEVVSENRDGRQLSRIDCTIHNDPLARASVSKEQSSRSTCHRNDGGAA